jgi:hypothetical protein
LKFDYLISNDGCQQGPAMSDFDGSFGSVGVEPEHAPGFYSSSIQPLKFVFKIVTKACLGIEASDSFFQLLWETRD